MNYYRTDIDGLRAIAVLSILVFHLNKEWLPGGFTGVDVFFVISGFLITSIIYPKIMRGQFSYKDFYMRRIKRIVPAAFFYTFLTLIITAFIYLPNDWILVSKSALSSVIFLSNLYLMRSVDYFSARAEENPFLHTWSLSVEEQFYVFWPFILVCMARFLKTKFHRMLFISFMLLTSFALAQLLIQSPRGTNIAFYMMPTRFGELLLGAILAIYSQRINAKGVLMEYLGVLGMLLLVISFFLIDERTMFPGFASLLPTTGAALVILSGFNQEQQKKTHRLYRLLSVPVLRHIGLISFSLYLVHWPLLAMTRYITQEYILTTVQLLYIVPLMFVLAHTSWRYIEMPFRTTKLTFNKTATYYYLVPAISVLILTSYIIGQDGLPARFGLKTGSFILNEKNICVDDIERHCVIGDKSTKPEYALIGDSHGSFYSSIFDVIGKQSEVSIVAKSVNNCSGVFSTKVFNTKARTIKVCQILKEDFQNTKLSYNGVIIAERWEARLKFGDTYFNALEKLIEDYAILGKEVILMRQVPKYNCNIPRASLLRDKYDLSMSCPILESDGKVEVANELIDKIARRHSNVVALGVEHLLCSEGDCSPYINGDFVYSDDDHLNLIGSKTLANMLLKGSNNEWKELIKRLGGEASEVFSDSPANN